MVAANLDGWHALLAINTLHAGISRASSYPAHGPFRAVFDGAPVKTWVSVPVPADPAFFVRAVALVSTFCALIGAIGGADPILACLLLGALLVIAPFDTIIIIKITTALCGVVPITPNITFDIASVYALTFFGVSVAFFVFTTGSFFQVQAGVVVKVTANLLSDIAGAALRSLLLAFIQALYASCVAVACHIFMADFLDHIVVARVIIVVATLNIHPRYTLLASAPSVGWKTLVFTFGRAFYLSSFGKERGTSLTLGAGCLSP